ncbi:MAG: hypothetical protein RL215_1873 [Planctomycetota bacterium]
MWFSEDYEFFGAEVEATLREAIEGGGGEVPCGSKELRDRAFAGWEAFRERCDEFEAGLSGEFGECFAGVVEEGDSCVESERLSGEGAIEEPGPCKHAEPVAGDFDGEDATGSEDAMEFLNIFAWCAMAAEGIEGAEDIEGGGRIFLVGEESVPDSDAEGLSCVCGGDAGWFDALALPVGVVEELAEEEAGGSTHVEQASAVGEEIANAFGVPCESFLARVDEAGFGRVVIRDVFIAEERRGFAVVRAFSHVHEAAGVAGDDGQLVADSDQGGLGGTADWAVCVGGAPCFGAILGGGGGLVHVESLPESANVRSCERGVICGDFCRLRSFKEFSAVTQVRKGLGWVSAVHHLHFLRG